MEPKTEWDRLEREWDAAITETHEQWNGLEKDLYNRRGAHDSCMIACCMQVCIHV